MIACAFCGNAYSPQAEGGGCPWCVMPSDPAEGTLEHGDLVRRLVDRHDNGDMQRLEDRLRALAEDPDRLARLEAAGLKIAPMVDLVAQWRNTLGVAASAVLLLTPRGWAPSGGMPMAEAEAAVAALLSGDAQEADGIMASGWEVKPRLVRTVHHVRALASEDAALGPLFERRAELLMLAFDDHEAGRYHASIPVVLAQVDGIAADVTDGRMFFTKRSDRMADVVADEGLATLPEALHSVREVLSADLSRTSIDGLFLRHGIMHGRELNYDTWVNSVKVFALLQAVAEWARDTLR